MAVRGQQAAVPVIGFLHGASPEAVVRQLAALREGLRETGYIEDPHRIPIRLGR
jgi:putative ABC transport system substrate-binding protein